MRSASIASRKNWDSTARSSSVKSIVGMGRNMAIPEPLDEPERIIDAAAIVNEL
jgi:hypothetical protein